MNKSLAVDFGKAGDRFPGILRHAKAAAVILCVARIHNPIQAWSQTPAASYSVTLAWDVHPDPLVTAYRVYFGSATRAYTANIAVGNATQATSLYTTSNGETVLTVRGTIGQSYDIEASQDLKTWTLISTVTIQDGGSLQFSHPDAASYPTRFYRTRGTP